MEFIEKQLSTRVTYEGKVINITLDDIELPDGKKSFREVIRHPGGVVAVAMKCVRVSRRTTQMQRMLHRIPKREWITDREYKH